MLRGRTCAWRIWPSGRAIRCRDEPIHFQVRRHSERIPAPACWHRNKNRGMLPGLKYDLQEAVTPQQLANMWLLSSQIPSFTDVHFPDTCSSTLHQGGHAYSIDQPVLPAQPACNAKLHQGCICGKHRAHIRVLFIFPLLPKVQARKIAENIDRDLVFALKDMQLQISSGVPLYDAMRNVAQADYGRVPVNLIRL